MNFTKAELVILQLNRFGDIAFDRFCMPYGMTQDGIATALCISKAHASLELKKLYERGLVISSQAHVMYRPKLINVYVLTSDGKKKAEELSAKARVERVDTEGLFKTKPMRKATYSTPTLMRVEKELKDCLECIDSMRQCERPQDTYPLLLHLMEAQKLLYEKEVRS